MFEFGGKNPAVYETIKSVLIYGVIILLAMLWYQLGVSLGMIPNYLTPSEDMKTVSSSRRVDLDSSFTGKFDVIDDENLLEQLQKSIKQKSSLNGTKDFLCCLVSKNPVSAKYKENQKDDIELLGYKKLRCHGLTKQKSKPSEFHKRAYTKKIARLRSATSALDCENGNLVYQLSIANN